MTTSALSLSISLFKIIDSHIIRLAEVATIILCTCFPMMPRLLKLISERKAKSKSKSKSPSPSASPLGHAWKRNRANGAKDETSIGAGGAGSHAAEGELTRSKHPYEQLGEEGQKMSDGSTGMSRSEDVEFALWDRADVRTYGDLLEHRLNFGFTLPQFSYV